MDVFYKSLETMQSQTTFLFIDVEPDNIPQLDIANEELKKFNLEKMFRTVLRMLFADQLAE